MDIMAALLPNKIPLLSHLPESKNNTHKYNSNIELHCNTKPLVSGKILVATFLYGINVQITFGAFVNW